VSEWYGSLPNGWETKRLKNFLSETKNTVGANSADYTLLSLTKLGIIIRNMDGGGKFPADFGTYKIVDPGQIIFCLFDVDETPRTVGLSNYKGMITGAYNVFNIKNITPKFLEYYFIAIDNVKGLRPLYTGLRKVVTIDKFLQMHIPLPPLPEQDQIVRYLDWKVSQINKLINAKKKEIELLKEQKQAVINNAVTKGGEGWKEMSLGKLGSFRKGHGGSRTDDDENGVACIRYGDIYRTSALILSKPITRINKNATPPYALIEKSEVLFALSGETKTEIGQAVVNNIDEITYTSGDVAIFKSNGYIHPKFLVYAIRCPYLVQQRASAAKGDIIVHISASALKSLKITMPVDYTEQKMIVYYLDKQSEIIDTAINNANRQIELLQEYRTRLISDVVTGKKDVRGIVVPEYETTEETVFAEIENDNENENEQTTEQED
jgi:type I restriction enzyme S subunit